MSTLEIRKLKAFGRQIQAGVPRDLDLISEIDNTLEVLDIEVEKFSQMNHAAGLYVEMARKTAPCNIGSLEEIEALFASSRQLVGEYFYQNEERRQAAANDPRLTDEDGIVEAYDYLLTVLASLQNNLNTITWLVGEHVADSDKKAPGAFSSAEELFAAMGV